MADLGRTREELYEKAAASCRGALDRLARAYERDPDKRRDLLQEIHVALWRSLEDYEGRCSLNTWVYRVAHNTATSMVTRRRANAPQLVGLEEVQPPRWEESRHAVDHQDNLRSAQRNLPLWYGLPVAPGLLVLIVALALAPDGRGVVPAALVAGSFAAVFMFTARANRRKVRQRQQHIGELRAR